MSAQDWEISASIQRNCREVWMPVPKDDLDVADSGHGGSGRPTENPDNFRLAWHVWDDYPYRKANLIEGPNPDDKGGFGPPTYTKVRRTGHASPPPCTETSTIFELWLGGLGRPER